jgi:hypothetical protein
VVELRDPLGKSLKAVHHGTIETVGGRSDEEQDNPGVQANETLVVLPSPGRVEEMVVASVTTSRYNSTGTHC